MIVEDPTLPVLVPELHECDPAYFGDVTELIRARTNVRDTLFVACSDHWCAPDNTSFAKPGRLYIVQNLATTIPAGTSPESSILGSVEFAVRLEQVSHAIVCGHLGCRIVPAWMESGVDKVPGVETSDFDRVVRPRVEEAYPDATADQLTRLMIVEHTLFQVENLQSHDFVRERLEDGRLCLHAWIVDDETARVFAFDPTDGQFHRL